MITYSCSSPQPPACSVANRVLLLLRRTRYILKHESASRDLSHNHNNILAIRKNRLGNPLLSLEGFYWRDLRSPETRVRYFTRRRTTSNLRFVRVSTLATVGRKTCTTLAVFHDLTDESHKVWLHPREPSGYSRAWHHLQF